ncbi:MAG: CoA-binding protein [Chloroflexota bacterium]
MPNSTSPFKDILDSIFPARSIAVVGVSNDPGKHLGGREYVNALVDARFPGKLYPVNPSGGELHGLKIYKSLQEVPDPVDFLISAIPAKYNIPLLRDCAAKGIKIIQIYSAGFSEIADPEGKKLEEELARTARETGVRVIGPNCMGIYAPKYNFSYRVGLPPESGSVGFISQSGSNSFHAIRDGNLKGLYFSKLFSYGNATDLTECDFLEYLAEDPETSVIGGYVEGVRDGRRLIDTLRKITPKKPVVIYKAGNTVGGSRAVASHSGALAGSERVWEAALRQCGVLQVFSMEELVEALMLFQYMDPPTGKNAILMGTGGGVIIQSTDETIEGGLNLPLLPAEVRKSLEKTFTTEAGGSFRNPVDIYLGRKEIIEQTVKLLTGLEQTDLLLMQIMLGFSNQTAMLRPYLKAIRDMSKKINRRTAIIIRPAGSFRYANFTLKLQQSLIAAGYPVFDSARRAATAISRYYDFCQRVRNLPKS